MRELESHAPGADDDNTFALLLIDGLSGREEPVAHALQSALGSIPLVGGSSGDGLDFGSTDVFFDGRFHADSAVLALITTELPFKPFKTQHFIATEQRVVVTDADPDHRIVREIDGRPATRVYAELIGVDVDDLNSTHFAKAPMVVVIDGINYVRSIRKATPDGSLWFYCAIDDGMVLRMAHGADLVGNLERTFAEIRDSVGEPQLVIGFDCVLRRLEIVQDRLVEQVEDVFLRNAVVGFCSYGEQYRGVHMNQTFTGIAIGNPKPETDSG